MSTKKIEAPGEMAEITRLCERHSHLAPSNADEPCLGCGEETAPGSVFYSDRREMNRDDGVRVFLCSDCQGAAHRARKGAPLSEEYLHTIANNGLMIGAGLLTGGGMG
jgi:hypothetical protein